MSVDRRQDDAQPLASLPLAFFQRDVLTVARELLGQVLVSQAGGAAVRLLVTETEAYHQDERGAHAYGGRSTPRNRVMFDAGGVAYVYFVYGMHWQFNVVTGRAGVAEAVLVRAGMPLDPASLHAIRQRRGWATGERKAPKDIAKWVDGPGKLTQALAIDRRHNGLAFLADQPLCFQAGLAVPEAEITVGPRVGIDYAGEDALLPWRFRWLAASSRLAAPHVAP